MLKNIKSPYFIRLIFSFADEVQKLKLVRYNKSIQKNLDISIINYKFFSGRYIIYESNGMGKEYNGYDGDLIFEGEYKNGERNGKGKEYDCFDNLIYEGEYLNGKRNGKGNGKNIDYDYFGELRFEGEYLNGKEWIGISYDDDGNIKYELNNSINGKGKEYHDNGKLQFEGQYLNGKRNGKGKEYDDKGKLLFEGEYKNNLKWNGIGYDPFGNIIYELKNGIGLIKEYNKIFDELEFEGEYLNGKRNGKGKEYYFNKY